MRKLFFLAIGAIILLSLGSCEKATVVSQASADVFIKSIKDPKDTSHVVYAAIHSVFSYDLIASASVVTPAGSTLQLTDYDKTGNSFYNAPADSTYSLTLPPLGTYQYTVTFKDKEVLTYTNSLSTSAVLPPIITSLKKSADADSVYLTWKGVTNAQYYQIMISQGANQVYYIKPFGFTSNPSVQGYGWPISAFTSGIYTFELDVLLFESAESGYLQAIGASKKSITL